MALAAVLALLLAPPGCGANDAEGGGADAPSVSDVVDGAGEVPDVTSYDGDLLPDLDASADALPVGHLEFVDAFGDDQKSCDDTDTCTYYAISARALGVRYVADGVPIAGAQVAFEVIADLGEPGQVASSPVVTDDEGEAVAVVEPPSAGGCVPYRFLVRASVVDQPAVAPLTFVITAIFDCYEPFLTVSFVYNGAKVFDGVKVYLFKSSLPAAADLACADVDTLDLPIADLQMGPFQLWQTAKFTLLPGLEDEQEQFYTILARAELMDGTPVAFGCNDLDGHVVVESSTHVTIALHDLPPHLVGAYDVTTDLDLWAALPDPASTVVNFVLAALEKPDASLLYRACDLDAPELQALCAAVFVDPANPDVYALTAFGQALLARMGEMLATVPQWTGTDVFGAGQAAVETLQHQSLGAVFEVACEPDANGSIPETCGHATWSLALSGSEDDLGTTTFASTFALSGDTATLAIAEHDAPLAAGRIVDALLERQELPALFGDGANGQPVIDSFERWLHALLGGKACLDAPADQPTCCQRFVDAVGGVEGAPDAGTLEATCERWVAAAAQLYRDLLLGLDPTTGSPARLATPAGSPCLLLDQNGDLKVDAWGEKLPASARCTWDLKMEIAGQTVSVPARFYGVEHQ
jgi:hypothetical protein